MALSGKILGQVSPSASTDTALYVVPASKQATASVWVCNTNASQVNVRVHLMTAAEAGGATAVKQRIIAKALQAGETLTSPVVALETGEKISVWVDTTNVGFNANGFEESV